MHPVFFIILGLYTPQDHEYIKSEQTLKEMSPEVQTIDRNVLNSPSVAYWVRQL